MSRTRSWDSNLTLQPLYSVMDMDPNADNEGDDRGWQMIQKCISIQKQRDKSEWQPHGEAGVYIHRGNNEGMENKEISI